MKEIILNRLRAVIEEVERRRKERLLAIERIRVRTPESTKRCVREYSALLDNPGYTVEQFNFWNNG